MPIQPRNHQLAESLVRIRADIARLESGIQQVSEECARLEMSLAHSQQRLADLQEGTAIPRPSRQSAEVITSVSLRFQAEQEVNQVIDKLKRTLHMARIRKAQLKSVAFQVPKLAHQQKMIEDELAAIEEKELVFDGHKLRQEVQKGEQHIIFLKDAIRSAEEEEHGLKLRLHDLQNRPCQSCSQE